MVIIFMNGFCYIREQAQPQLLPPQHLHQQQQQPVQHRLPRATWPRLRMQAPISLYLSHGTTSRSLTELRRLTMMDGW